MSDDNDSDSEYPFDEDDDDIACDYGDELLSDEEEEHGASDEKTHTQIQSISEVRYKPLHTKRSIEEVEAPTSRDVVLNKIERAAAEPTKPTKRAKCRKTEEVTTTTKQVSFLPSPDVPAVPSKCPVLKVPFPQTLLQAEAAHQATLPDPKFMKRMKITNEKCSLMSFVVHKINNENVTPATASVALTLDEKDSIYDEHVCEQCNEIKILDSRTAQSVCLSCGESSTYMVPDTSYREGVSLHTPYCKYIIHNKARLHFRY